MAICKGCGREMLTTNGCGVSSLIVDGKRHKRIKFGSVNDLFPDQRGRCGDCGARRGHFHHVGCDCERCPACGHQLLSCDCNAEFAEA